jgi:hypothetical protein
MTLIKFLKGFRAGKFLERGPLLKPNQELLNVDKVPYYYRADDFFIGAIITANNFKFVLTNADEYALSYMECNSAEFPKSNNKLILDKIRPHLSQRYKELVLSMLAEDDKNAGMVAAGHFRFAFLVFNLKAIITLVRFVGMF